MSHNSNPFDFIPFAKEGPVLKTPQEWLSLGNLRTGRIKVEMKALTPVHIMGEQPMDGKNIKESRFYQRHGKHYIPGSSIRGALRAFIEAASNGWASQLTPYYEKEKKKRTYGFKVVDSETPEQAKISNLLSDKTSIDQDFCIPLSSQKGIDLASFLFGYIPRKTDDKDEFNSAMKGRVNIDDIELNLIQLSFGTGKKCHEIPDLNNSDAFMGGPHPSASSWWYQYPFGIVEDEISTGNKQKISVYHFVGSEFRGRKFYFHHAPDKSVKEYRDFQKWGLLHFFPIQCMEKSTSVVFDIFFNNIPEVLLNVLFFVLEPCVRIRHKIGYGKAYGYGSIDFSIQDIVFQEKGFEDSKCVDVDEIRALIRRQITLYNAEDKNSVACFLHKPSFQMLSFVLGYEKKLENIFTYPCAGQSGFNVSLSKEERHDYNTNLNKLIKKMIDNSMLRFSDGLCDLGKAEGKKIAEILYKVKPTLDFSVYQERSDSYLQLKKANNFSIS